MADQKLTALTEATTLAATDRMYVVTDPGGTPLSQYAEVSTALGLIEPVISATGNYTINFEVIPPFGYYLPGNIYRVFSGGAFFGSYGSYEGLTDLTAIEFTNLVGVEGEFKAQASNTPFLETLSLPALRVTQNGFQITATTITSLSCPLLENASQQFTIQGISAASISFPVLAVTGNFHINGSSTIVDAAFPSLTYTILADVTDMSALETIDLTALVSVQAMDFGSAPLLEEIDLSALVEVRDGRIGFTDMAAWNSLDMSAFQRGGFYISGAPALPSVSLPAVIRLNELDVSDATILTSFSLGSGLLEVQDSVSVIAPLDQTSVDNILVRLAALDGTGGTVSYDNNTVSLNDAGASTPSGTGLAAKATLEGRGNTVNVN